MITKDSTYSLIVTQILSDFKLNLQDQSCAACEDFLARVSYLLGTDDFAEIVYTDLSGAVFCEDPTYVNADEVAECKGSYRKFRLSALRIQV